MLDYFREEVITHRKRTAESLVYALANAGMVLFAVYALFMVNIMLALLTTGGVDGSMLLQILLLFLTAAAAVLLFLYKDRIRTEYEYTFTNGTMDFAKVFNNRKRKPLGTMDVRNVEACGMVDSGSFRRYLSVPGVLRLNWFLNRDARLFYFYFVKDGKKSLMVLEPSEAMLELIRKFVGQGKFQTN
jgi:hypothetical protein